MNGLLSQAISNHPVFTDVNRTVVIDSFQPVASRKELTICYSIQYERNGVDVTEELKQPEKNIYANNDLQLLVRGENFEPLEREGWTPEYAEDGTTLLNANDPSRYQKQPAFDYLIQFIDMPVKLTDIIRAYILDNDSDGFFNK